MVIKRPTGRSACELRPVKITYNFFEHAAGSVLLEMGNTKVACAVSLQNSVPSFLKGTGSGWLNAEYAMLPVATKMRTQRELSSFKRNGRSVEISRLIGRSLRSVLDLDIFGERTIIVDCDVLSADGGTRTASITGAYIALQCAVDYWLEQRILKKTILRDAIAAVSVGLLDGQALLDVDFAEDSSLDADFNFVLSKSGKIIEIQGCSEKHPISWDDFATMQVLALQGVQQLFELVQQSLTDKKLSKKSAPLFSLQSRLKSAQ